MLKRPFFQRPAIDHLEQSTDLYALREKILLRILTGAIPLGFVAYFSSLPERIQEKNWGVVIAFSLALALLLIIAFVRKIPYTLRALIFLCALAGVGITTLFADGLYGSGRVYLLALPISAGLLLGFLAGLSGLFVSISVLAGIGLLMVGGQLPAPVVDPGTGNLSLQSWMVAIASFALVSIVVTMSLILIIRGLEKTINQSQDLSNILDTERAQLEHRILQRTQDLERRLVQLRTAAEIIRTLGSYLDPVVLLQRVVDLVRDRFNLYYVGVFLIDELGDYAVLQAGTGDAGVKMLAAGHRLAVDDTSMIGWCVAHRQARIALDVGYDAVRFNNPHLPLTRSELALPMLGTKQTIGALTIQSSEPRAFDQDEIVVLQVIADSLATAVENARLFQQVQLNLEEIRRFNKQYLINAWQETIQELDINPTDLRTNLLAEQESTENYPFPLVLREQEIGKLFLEMDDQKLTSEEQAFVEAVTTQTALALENVRLLEKTQRQASYERLLAEVSRKVRSSTDIDTILRVTVKELGQILGASEGLIQLEMASPEMDRSINPTDGLQQSEEIIP